LLLERLRTSRRRAVDALAVELSASTRTQVSRSRRATLFLGQI
jgi:hypothetical protein